MSQNVIKLFLFSLLPSVIIATILSSSIPFFVSTTIPVLFSILGVLVLTSMKYDEFYIWLKAVSFTSLFFLFVGIIKFGFIPTDYFGRPRVHFGFTHPVQTASVILSVFAPYTIFPNKLSVSFKRLLKIVLLIFLFMAQSLNIFISVLLIFLFSFLVEKKFNKYFIFLFSFFLFLTPYTIYFSNFLPDFYYNLIDIFTSGRLSFFSETLLVEINNDNFINMLFGPMYQVRQLYLNGEILKGFSFVDSVFFSFLFSFGVLGFIYFVSFLFYLLFNSFNKHNYSFQLLTGLIFFYSADSQGFTPNNLILFSILAYVIRANFKVYKYGN
jgi:hypothetical protein